VEPPALPGTGCAGSVLYFPPFTFSGELPLGIIRMRGKGIVGHFGLSPNTGFTLPMDIGALGGAGIVTELDLSNCSLTGPLSFRAPR